MKTYKMLIEAYFSAESLEEAKEYAAECEPVSWDAYVVHPPIEILDEAIGLSE